MIYTGLRTLVFAATLGIVIGVWALFSDEVHLLWSLVIAFVVSGLVSVTLLNRPRAALAARVEARASRAVDAFERNRSKED